MSGGFLAIAIAAVAHGGKWDGAESDVRVTRLVDAEPRVIHEQLDDLREWTGRWPEDCATQAELGPTTTGAEASAAIRYTFGPLRRRLEMRVSRDEPGHVFEIEHPSKRGWFAQVTYQQVDEGTEIVLLTPLNPPPWPFKGVFFRKIRPAMEDCYRRWLTGIQVSEKPTEG